MSSFELLVFWPERSMHGGPFTCRSCQSNVYRKPRSRRHHARPGAIGTRSIGTLRARWRGEFRCDPPPAFGPDLLRRSLAHKLQEEAYGKLVSATQRELDRLVAALEKNPTARIALPRRIKPGSVLVRDWKGKNHRVTVLASGFEYDARHYTSLSEIARKITGTRWNGPRFFGLRTERKETHRP